MSDPSPSPLFPPDAVGRKLEEAARLYQRRLRELQQLKSQLQNLSFLYEVGKAMGSILDLNTLLDKVMDVAVDATRAERGFIMLLDEHGDLDVHVARKMKGQRLDATESEVSLSIARKVLQEGKSVCFTDVTGDQIFSQKTSILKLDLRSIMCAPLMVRDRALGVLYVDSRTVSKNYSRDDLSLFESLAQHAAIALENATLYDQIREKTLEQERTKRLTAMGQMAAGIAHEVRNPLGIINTAAYFLKATETAPDEERDEQFGIIDAEIKRANHFIDELLQFSRPREIRRAPVDLNGMLEDLKGLLGREERFREMAWRLNLATDLPVIQGDAEQLRQVFTNILVNAADACRGKGTLTFRTRKTGTGVVVTLLDDGPGIPEDILPKIFDPFFTTKAASKGTGLGLAISHGIVEKHGGSLTVRSVEGEGASFRVYLESC